MSAIVWEGPERRHLPVSETKPPMVKADLRKSEIALWREQLGKAIERAKALSGLNLNQFADEIGRNERQVARWITGDERPQFDAIFASDKLRQPIVIALAEMAGDGVCVETIVRVRRMS